MNQIKNKIKTIFKSPVRQMIFSFLMLILAGTLLLLLPWATYNNITFIDAVFTSTSAVCVTGLTVADTAKDFTFFGQTIILILIQLGGLGIMTFSVAIFSILGGEFSIKWRFAFNSIYNNIKILPPRLILKKIFIYTFVIEFITALLLFTQFIQKFELKKALWHSIFHAVSAFCNAGFSTFSNSLMDYSGSKTVLIVISLSVILGGIGFIALTEIRNISFPIKKDFFQKFSLHTKIVLITSIILILTGTIFILILEWSASMKGLPFQDKMLASFFQSVSCRTAGFNSIDLSSLRESTHSFMMLLMFIGGSPGSIAGGIKTTTFAIIIMMLITKFRGKKQVIFWNRAISEDTIQKSTNLLILGIFFICVATFILLSMHSFDKENSFLSVIFEVISAFGTVGLSLGITQSIPPEGKLLVSIIMFIGRIGPFAIITALTANIKNADIEIAEENIMIG